MKKLLLLACMCMVLVGCSSSSVSEGFMLTRDDDYYALYNRRGKRITGYEYKTFIELIGTGFVVSNRTDKVALIDYDGEPIIDYGKYDKLEIVDEMLYATIIEDIDEDDQESEPVEHLYILDHSGDTLFQPSEDIEIVKDILPIIKEGETSKVLYGNGEMLIETDQTIEYLSVEEEYNSCIVGFEDHMSFFYSLKSTPVEVVVDTQGEDYVILGENTLVGAALYDSSNWRMYFIDYTTNSYDLQSVNATDVNITLEGKAIFTSSIGDYVYTFGKKPVLVNSYYVDDRNYILRSDDIYGPHYVYYNGDLVGQLEDCQLYPMAVKITSNYYPIYRRGEGYYYYDFEGNQVIETSYQEAEPFDSNSRAIVKDETGAYTLIDEKGNAVLTEGYSKIEYLEMELYAVYNDIGAFMIVNKDGQEVLPMGYTGKGNQAIVRYADYVFLILEKNGRSYVYDYKDKYNVVLSAEGKLEMNEKGYFSVKKTYYTLEGDIIN